ncbi:MAG: WbqC family protein [Chitinophagaceae bacterium]
MILVLDNQYFAPITEFKSLSKSNFIITPISVLYKKQSFANRMFLAGSQGIQDLSIPILGGRSKRQIFKDVKMDHRSNWRLKHWRTIESCYRRSPFFEYYEKELKELFVLEIEFLWIWNNLLLKWVLNKIGSPALIYTDLDQNLCTTPINDGNIQVLPKNYKEIWLQSQWEPYLQVFQDKNGFLPNLSILDLIFCLGPEAFTYLKDKH